MYKTPLTFPPSCSAGNTIYDLVLLQRGSPEMTLDSTSISMFTRRWNEPALFRTSKQIRQEAMSIYYLGRTWEFCIKYHEMESLYARLARISEEIGGQWPEFTVRVSDGKANKGAALALMRLAYRSTHIRGDSDGDWIVPRMDLMYSTGIAKAREEAREQKREREINQLVERTEQAKCDGMPLDELETKWFGKKETKAGRKGTKSKKGSKSAKSTTNASGTVR